MSLKFTESFDVINNYHQYRSIDKLYSFKPKKNENLKLKIFNILQKCIFKKTFSVRCLCIDIQSILCLYQQTNKEFIRTKHFGSFWICQYAR